MKCLKCAVTWLFTFPVCFNFHLSLNEVDTFPKNYEWETVKNDVSHFFLKVCMFLGKLSHSQLNLHNRWFIWRSYQCCHGCPARRELPSPRQSHGQRFFEKLCPGVRTWFCGGTWWIPWSTDPRQHSWWFVRRGPHQASAPSARSSAFREHSL